MNTIGPDESVQQLDRVGVTFIADVQAALRAVPVRLVSALTRVLEQARERGARVYVLGNGGSASTASHLACDLTKTAQPAGARPLRAQSLTADTAMLTAFANDTSYQEALARQLVAYADPTDVVVAISASGQSPNILTALDAARRLGLASAGLLGCGGGRAAELMDLALVVDSSDFGVIETVHIAIAHALTAALRSVNPEPSVESCAGAICEPVAL
jgi:D-sedoheptulose 7-phosphate isomerase